MKILIIEDEIAAANRLKRMLLSYDDNIELLEVIDSVLESVNYLCSHPPPDLILMDIQLSDGTCFEIFEQIELHCPIIFATAYDEYALQAFKVNSVDYLLKPIHQKDLDESLAKFEKFQYQTNGDNYRSLTQNINLKKGYKFRFLVKVGGCFQSVETQDIAYFFSEDKLTYLVSNQGKKYIVEFSLEELTNRLDPVKFFKISRQFMVSHPSINNIHPFFNNRLKLELVPEIPKDVFVSRSNVREFKQWLDT